jgi:hypothetical protein
VVTYGRHIAPDNDLDIAAASLSIAADKEADKEADVTVTTCFNASNNDVSTSKRDQIRPSRRPSEPLPVGAPAPPLLCLGSQPGLERLNRWSSYSPHTDFGHQRNP